MNFVDIEKNIKNKLCATNVWIPIYQNNYETEYSTQSWFMTFSENKENELSSPNWSEMLDSYYCRRKGDFGGPKYFLVIYRHGNQYLDKIEIAEDFRFFYNLFEINNEYYIGDYDVEPEKIIRYNEGNQLYEIKFHYLADYCFHKKIYAVLNFEEDYYHDNLMVRSKTYNKNNFVCVKNSFPQESYKYKEKYSNLTRYMGKLILDYEDYSINEESPIKFLIGKTKKGNDKYVTITGSNASKECDVCFDRRVLSKYYDCPETYHIAYSNVICGKYWSLDGFNSETFREITVSTHNLKRIPFKEKLHWSKYCKISEDTKFLNKEINQTSLLITNIKNFKFYWEKHINNIPLFKELSKDNRYKYHQIYVPISMQISEFFKVIENICVCVVEAIDTAMLRSQTTTDNITLNAEGKPEKGTRVALRDFFNDREIDFSEYDDFLKYLIAIRDNSAHIKSEKYLKAKEYFNLDKIGTQQCIVNIATTLNKLLCDIAKTFGFILKYND